MASIKIGGRTFELAFTLDAMAEMERSIPGFDLSKISEYPRTAQGLGDVLLALMRQGEYLQGRALDVDRAWLGAHIKPAAASVTRLQVAVLDALTEGLTMETEQQENEEQDLVLLEIKKKETPDA